MSSCQSGERQKHSRGMPMKDDRGNIYHPAKRLGIREAQRMADKLFECFGDQHINFAKVYSVFSDRPPSFSFMYKEDIPIWMHDMKVYGLAVDSKGPKGGKGWKMTGRKAEIKLL